MAPAEAQAAVPNQPPAPAPVPPAGSVPGVPNNVAGAIPLDRDQIMQLLSHIPGIFPKVTGADGNLKEDAAQILSNLSQSSFAALGGAPAGTLPHGLPPPGTPGFPSLNDPGPSSHPRGPPNLGQLSAVAMQAAPPPPPPPHPDPEGDGDSDGQEQSPPASAPAPATTTTARRGGRGGAATMGSDEWTRQRKDNHKEVERRRRGNINEGINELGRIVPNGSGEKSKGAILSRAVQYIHHLKENEARNIEKWTLEKLLMDQAMGDLQAQLEEMRRAWEEERGLREKAERELNELRKNPTSVPAGIKRSNEDGDANDEDVKRQRTE